MKPIKHYIFYGIIIFSVFLVMYEFNNYFFGATTKMLGGSYGPQTVEEIFKYHLLKDSIAILFVTTIGLVVLYQNDKFKWKQKNEMQNKKEQGNRGYGVK